MKTMKTIIATLFTMMAVSMPVHAQLIKYTYPNTEWRMWAHIDEMTDEIKLTRFFNEYKDGFRRVTLYVDSDCDLGPFISSRKMYNPSSTLSRDEIEDRIFFDERYQSNTENLLIRFDKNDVFYTRVRYNGFGIMGLTTEFLLKFEEHKVLRIKLHMKDESSIIAKFNIAGFSRAYQYFRFRFCK